MGSRPALRPKPVIFEAKARPFEAKAMATIFCPRAVLEVEDSPRGLHPCSGVYSVKSTREE